MFFFLSVLFCIFGSRSNSSFASHSLKILPGSLTWLTGIKEGRVCAMYIYTHTYIRIIYIYACVYVYMSDRVLCESMRPHKDITLSQSLSTGRNQESKPISVNMKTVSG